MKIPTNTSVPVSLFLLNSNLGDVRRLQMAGRPSPSGHLDRRSAEIVSRSAVVLLCACWEAYLEDLALEGIAFLARRASSGAVVSHTIQAAVNRAVTAASVDSAARLLMGSLIKHRDAVLGNFNTPKWRNIDSLFSRSLGLDDLTLSWTWRGVVRSEVKERLDHFVTLRGDIAHRTKSLKPVRRSDVHAAVTLIERLSWLTCNSTRIHLLRATGSEPWQPLPSI